MLSKQAECRIAVTGGDRLAIDLLCTCERWGELGDFETIISRAANAAYLACQFDSGTDSHGAAELCVLLADDARLHELNRQFRRQDKPTNVLSFPTPALASTTDAEPVALGDIALAYETLNREAADLGIALHAHATHLVVHGVLHLMGYDHETDDDAAEMEALETRILAGLGIDDPYAGTEPVSASLEIRRDA